MPVSQALPTSAPASLNRALAGVRARGLRASSARRLVLATLCEADRPLTAEEVAAGVDGRVPASDLGSVYRNLDTLAEVGLVRHLHAAHGPGLYALARGEDEGFVACERCGEVRAADPRAVAAVRIFVRRALGYDARFVHFPIVGVCAACTDGAAQ
jgi:Fur family ferric uptake transcriptional regulator